VRKRNEFIHIDLREEILVADQPAGAQLGIPNALELRTEALFWSVADRRRQEQASRSATDSSMKKPSVFVSVVASLRLFCVMT
jgi:hypothetical protein